MKKLLLILPLILIVNSAFTQVLQNTTWLTYNPLLADTVTVEIKTDTIYQYVTKDTILVVSTYQEINDTVSIFDISGPFMCSGPDTGFYQISISNDTMLVNVITDNCLTREQNYDGSVLWKVKTLTAVTEFKDVLYTTQIYPNPSNGLINVKSAESGSMRIYNNAGQLVFEKKIKADFNSFQTALPTGLYLISIQNIKGYLNQKLLIN